MKTLLKNAKVVNVFTESIDLTNVLIEDDRIVGIGTYYTDADVDVTEDLGGKYVCPGFIDGHIHIESTMMIPSEFAKVAVKTAKNFGFHRQKLTYPHKNKAICYCERRRWR